jgi:hypothetical protein
MSFEFKNKVILKDAETKWGWEIKSYNDLVLAAKGMPEFETVYDVRGVVDSVLDDMLFCGLHFKDFNAFCEYCSYNYI